MDRSIKCCDLLSNLKIHASGRIPLNRMILKLLIKESLRCVKTDCPVWTRKTGWRRNVYIYNSTVKCCGYGYNKKIYVCVYFTNKQYYSLRAK